MHDAYDHIDHQLHYTTTIIKGVTYHNYYLNHMRPRDKCMHGQSYILSISYSTELLILITTDFTHCF